MKLFKLLFMTAAILALCACSTTANQNRWSKRIVSKEKLKQGKFLKVGYQAPHGDWGCIRMHRDEFNWSVDQFKSAFTLQGSAYATIISKAVNYTNDNPKLGINYAYIYIPNQTSVMGFNVTLARKASINYYKCKMTPKENHDPFDNKINTK